MSLFSVFLLTGFALFLLMMVAWNIQIENRAFHCTDDIGFGIFLEDMDVHKQAGDTICPGWTWGKINALSTAYKIFFFSLWFSSSAVAMILKYPTEWTEDNCSSRHDKN